MTRSKNSSKADRNLASTTSCPGTARRDLSWPPQHGQAAQLTIVAKDAVLVTDGSRAYEAFTAATNIVHIAPVASQRKHMAGYYHTQNDRLKLWMTRFKGVASKYLPSYLSWRRMI